MNPDRLTPEDVRDELRIDRDQLDHELLGQPELVYDVNMSHAAAINMRDSFKEQLKRIEADASAMHRARLERTSSGRVTKQEVEDAVEADHEVMEARDELSDLAARVRRWEVCSESVKARGYALHKLVDMALTHGAAVAGQFEHGDRRSRRDRERADAEVQEARRARKDRAASSTTTGKRRARRDVR
jgi:cysteinyl-tRNA synthetase